jgi:hypothetical protein
MRPEQIGIKWLVSYSTLSDNPVLKWIWEKEFAAVAGDMPAFEALPFQSTTHWMHEWLLAGWGILIGELFDLERLTGESKRLKKWTFFLSSVPLNVSFWMCDCREIY